MRPRLGIKPFEAGELNREKDWANVFGSESHSKTCDGIATTEAQLHDRQPGHLARARRIPMWGFSSPTLSCGGRTHRPCQVKSAGGSNGGRGWGLSTALCLRSETEIPNTGILGCNYCALVSTCTLTIHDYPSRIDVPSRLRIVLVKRGAIESIRTISHWQRSSAINSPHRLRNTTVCA